MVSQKCINLMHQVLETLNIKHGTIELGEVKLLQEFTQEQRKSVKAALKKSGMVVMDDSNDILIDKVKRVVVEMVFYSDELPKVNYAAYISEKLNYDCAHMKGVFAEMTGMTLDQYIVLHKIEKAKELLLYDGLPLKEISSKLNYNSAAYLAQQFKKVTGLPPTFFKKLKEKRAMVMKAVRAYIDYL